MRVYETFQNHESENEDDPEILIQGWGKLPRSLAKKRVSDHLKQISDRVNNGDFNSVQAMLYNGTLEAFISAIKQSMDE